MTNFGDNLKEKTGKEYLSYTSLKLANQDMKLFELYVQGKLYKDSDALTFGSMYDTMLFEPDKFNNRFFVLDDSAITYTIGGKAPRMTTKYKDWKTEFLSKVDTDKLKVVSVEDHDQAIDMINRLEETGVVQTYLKGKYQEELIGYIDDIPLHGFLDCLGKDFVSDSKTVRSIDGFKYDVFKFGYDLQAYIYSTLSGLDTFYWVCQDKGSPYLVGVFEASPETIASGRRKFEAGIENIRSYIEGNKSTTTYYVMGYI